MFIGNLKTALVESLRATFVEAYPEHDFRNIDVSIEYPMEEKNYPGVWVDFTPTQPIQSAGINHVEWIRIEGEDSPRKTTVFRYGGTILFTCVALTSLERDRLVDEMSKILAFGLLNPERAIFRNKLIANDMIAVDPQWDKFGINGKAESQGTPWGTNEVVYEQTVSMDCTGLFRTDLQEVVMVPLTGITVYEWVDGQTPPPVVSEPGWQ